MHARYPGQTVAFLTQHGKETLLAPLLEPVFGCRIQRVEGYDTDQLGTFSGEVRRLDNQIETARQKARIGMALSGLHLGIASEGAVVSDPMSGLVPWNIEVLVWLDQQAEFEVIGIAQGPALSLHRAVQTFTDLETFATHAGFPTHHLVMRPESESDRRIYKGISDWAQLKQTFIDCQKQAANGYVHVEHDHRAFCHPTRQAMIRNAAQDLLKKFQSMCPRCETPGFAVTAHTAGLPCLACGRPTSLPRAYTLRCNACHHTEERPSSESTADPSRCDTCNP